MIGDEYSIDGAVIDGELQITLLRKKIITPLPIRQPISSFAEMDDEMYSRVKKFMQKVVDVLDYSDCLVNADLIINDSEIFCYRGCTKTIGT